MPASLAAVPILFAQPSNWAVEPPTGPTTMTALNAGWPVQLELEPSVASDTPTPGAPGAGVSDATDGSSSNCTGQPAFKAVIVVGPVGGSTAQFEGWANKIGTAASDAGMNVCKVYT